MTSKEKYLEAKMESEKPETCYEKFTGRTLNTRSWNQGFIEGYESRSADVKELVEIIQLDKRIQEFECDHDAEHQCTCGSTHQKMVEKYESSRYEALEKFRGDGE